jgi:hypothetical protein
MLRPSPLTIVVTIASHRGIALFNEGMIVSQTQAGGDNSPCGY